MSLSLNMGAHRRASIIWGLEIAALVLGTFAFVMTTLLVVAGPDFLMSGCQTFAGLD